MKWDKIFLFYYRQAYTKIVSTNIGVPCDKVFILANIITISLEVDDLPHVLTKCQRLTITSYIQRKVVNCADAPLHRGVKYIYFK